MSITDDIFAQLSGPALQQISQQLGTGQAQTAGAVAAAGQLTLLRTIPTIVSALKSSAEELKKSRGAAGGGLLGLGLRCRRRRRR